MMLGIIFLLASLFPPQGTVFGAPGSMLIASEGYDNNRDVLNASETKLSPATVNVTSFGKIATFTVDEAVYAQPLYIPGSPDILIVATMNDSVYAFNADTLSNTPIWTANLRNAGSAVPFACVSSGESYISTTGNVGVLSTPVYDPSTQTIYAVSFSYAGGTCTQFSTTLTYSLNALALSNGAQKFSGPVTLPLASDGGNVYLNLQRTGLVLSGGQVYVMWASWGDLGSYSGIAAASYDSGSLAQTSYLNLDPTPTATSGSGVWMSGRAPVIDGSGNVYLVSGNGDCNYSTQWGQSFLKLTSGTTTIADWFTTDSCATLNMGDQDIGSSGPILVPGTNYLWGLGKDDTIRVVNITNMGHHTTSDSGIVQTLALGAGKVFSGPAYFNGHAYIWSGNTTLNAYTFNTSTGQFTSSPAFTGTNTWTTGYVNPALAISANGTSNGIVWASGPLGNSGHGATANGILYAYQAGVSGLPELWDSQQNSSRDAVGEWSKFRSPVVDNGRVFLGTNSSTVVVYGVF
jgi:hypothetical protein